MLHRGVCCGPEPGSSRAGHAMSELDIVEGGAAIEEVASSKKHRHPLPDHCYACGADTLGPYCHQCGQKNDNCRRSILHLVGESFVDFASVDGRALRTVRSVVTRPGKHVREYGDGKRSPYSPPIRFFLAITFLFFTTLWLTETELVWFHLTPEVEDGEITGFHAEGGFLEKPGDIGYTDEEREALLNVASENVETDLGENIQIMGKETSWDRVIDAAIEISERPALFNDALNDWVPRLMIGMIPLMSLLGAIWIRGRDALLYDHLLLSLNTHSVAFLILTVGLWTSAFAPPAALPWAFFAGVPLYYLVASKGAFRRGWIKTTLGMLTVFFWYSIVLLIGLGWASVSAFSRML